MELLIRLYSDKPSKIGVKYTYEYLAVKAYEAIMEKNAGYVFSLSMELVRDKVNLVLSSDQTGARVLYKDLGYKHEQLKKLQTLLNPGSDLEFVHIFSKANTLMIAKPFRSQSFIKLSHYEITGTETRSIRL